MIRTYKASSLVIKKLLKILLVIFISYLLLAFIFAGERSYSFTFDRAGLKTEIESQLQNAEGKYGIFVKNLSTNEEFLQNEDTVFQSGSLYKLWVMAATFEQIKPGKIKEDDLRVADVAALN